MKKADMVLARPARQFAFVVAGSRPRADAAVRSRKSAGDVRGHSIPRKSFPVGAWNSFNPNWGMIARRWSNMSA